MRDIGRRSGCRYRPRRGERETETEIEPELRKKTMSEIEIETHKRFSERKWSPCDEVLRDCNTTLIHEPRISETMTWMKINQEKRTKIDLDSHND